MTMHETFTKQIGDSWNLFGQRRWWVVRHTHVGYDGVGNLIIIRDWMWNNSEEIIRSDEQHMSYDDWCGEHQSHQ